MGKFHGMGKGEVTRQAILDRAVDLGRLNGIIALSIGRLAEELELSKSGIYAHFGSKEALEVAIVRAAQDQFVDRVVRPALREKRGQARVRALFQHWMKWGEEPGGCFFLSAQSELDDRPGPARDALVQAQRDWLDTIATAARIAVGEGHFRRNLDCEQFAFEFYIIGYGYHFLARVVEDPKSWPRTEKAFDSLCERARAQG